MRHNRMQEAERTGPGAHVYHMTSSNASLIQIEDLLLDALQFCCLQWHLHIISGDVVLQIKTDVGVAHKHSCVVRLASC